MERRDGGRAPYLVADFSLPAPTLLDSPQLADRTSTALAATSPADDGDERVASSGGVDGAGGRAPILVADAHASGAASAARRLADRAPSGTVFFSADDGLSGRELWRSDGLPGESRAGHRPPSGRQLEPRRSPRPRQRAALRRRRRLTGRELWASVTSGAGMVQWRTSHLDRRYQSGPARSPRGPGALLGRRRTLRARALGERRHPRRDADTRRSPPRGLLGAGGLPGGARPGLFRGGRRLAGREPWVSDGTPAGTQLLADLAAVGGSAPTGFVQAGGYVLFIADDGVTGRELWRTDGRPGGDGAGEEHPPGGRPIRSIWCSTGTRAFFTADDGTNGRELWTSDGTIAGTYLVEDRAQNQYSINVPYLLPVGELVYFWMDHCDVICESGFFRSDGSPGSIVLASANSCGYLNNEPTVAAGRLFFSGYAQRPGLRALRARRLAGAGRDRVRAGRERGRRGCRDRGRRRRCSPPSTACRSSGP